MRQRSHQHFDHHRQTVALVPELPTAQRRNTGLCGIAVARTIGDVVALLVYEPAFGEWFVTDELLLYFAAGHHGHGHVQHEGRALLAGRREGDGLGPQAAVGAAKGSQKKTAAVEPDHADHALFGDTRGIVAEAADVGNAVEADEAERRLSGFVDGNVDCPVAGDDAIGALAVDDAQGGGIADGFGVFPADVTLLHCAGVTGDEPGAVRVVAVEVVVDQVVGDNAGIVGGNAGSFENFEGQLTQRCLLDNGHDDLTRVFFH